MSYENRTQWASNLAACAEHREPLQVRVLPRSDIFGINWDMQVNIDFDRTMTGNAQ